MFSNYPSTYDGAYSRNLYQQQYQSLAEERARQQRAQELAEQRSRRAKYLPVEDQDSDDEWRYSSLLPRERAYLDARKRQDMIERQKQDLIAEKENLWQAALQKRQAEDQEARQKLLEERRRQIKLRREEEQRQLAAAEHERQQENLKNRPNRSRSPSSSGRSPPQSIPIHIHRSPSPSPSKSPGEAQPESEPLKAKHTADEEQNAALRIQKTYRTHAAFRSLDDIAERFETLKSNFVYPSIIDFQKLDGEGDHIRVELERSHLEASEDEEVEQQLMDVDGPEGKLAYTSTNFVLNTYVEALDKLLMKLDGVESWGERNIREKRRGIVKDIEKEVLKVEKYWKQAWDDRLRAQAGLSLRSENQLEEQTEYVIVDKHDPSS